MNLPDHPAVAAILRDGYAHINDTVTCDICGEPIYDDYYLISDEVMCEDCLNKLYRRTIG